MAVMFTTRNGRTLINYEHTAADLDIRITVPSAVIEGVELGTQGHPVFHVPLQHVVEWWDKPDRGVSTYSALALLSEDDLEKKPRSA